MRSLRCPHILLGLGLSWLLVLAPTPVSAQSSAPDGDAPIIPVDVLGPGWSVYSVSTEGSTDTAQVTTVNYQLAGARPRTVTLATVLTPGPEDAEHAVADNLAAWTDAGYDLRPAADWGDGTAYTGVRSPGSSVDWLVLYRVERATVLVRVAAPAVQAATLADEGTRLAQFQLDWVRGHLDDRAVPPTVTCGGSAPTFSDGFAALKALLGVSMGLPTGCARATDAQGDAEQSTSVGLASYDVASNTPSFSNGSRSWSLTADGLIVQDTPG